MRHPPEREVLFRSLHNQYAAMVRQVSLGYMKGDRHAAEDLAQDVFINVWNALDSFRKEASFKTWIYRITVNTCLLYLRKSSKIQHGFPLEAVDSHDGVETAAAEERVTSLYAAIGSLPEIERLIMMMMLEELSYEEIAAVTGITAANLRVKIHRIKKKMRDLLIQN